MRNHSALAKRLKDAGYSLTKSREIVFAALDGQEPISMTELVSRVERETDRASVYRTIKLFEKLGIVQKLQIGWKYKLELGDEFHDHHHHIACIRCSTVVPIEEHAEIESIISTLAQINNFKILSHQLELRGICNKCQKS